MTVLIKQLNRSVLDNVNITDVPTLVLTDISAKVVNVFDSLNTTESISRIIKQLNLSASDSVSITESISRLIKQLNLSVSDSLNATESMTPTGLIELISTFDPVNLTESISALLTQLNINISDSINLTDVASLLLDTLKLAVNDDLTLTDAVSLVVGEAVVGLSLDVNDAVTLTEAVTMFIKQLNTSVNDNTTITENITFFFKQLNINISDNLTLTEFTYLVLDILRIAINDNLTLTDVANLAINTFGDVSTYDSIGITEYVKLRRKISYFYFGVDKHAYEPDEPVINKEISDIVTLVDNTATPFLTVSIAAGQYISGTVHYELYATSGGEYQIHAGILTFAAVNKAGTITGDIDEVYLAANETEVKTAGTFADVWTIVDNTDNTVSLKCNANTSFNVPPTLTYKAILHGNKIYTLH